MITNIEGFKTILFSEAVSPGTYDRFKRDVDEAVQRQFLELAREFPAAFGNPSTLDFDMAVRVFVQIVKEKKTHEFSCPHHDMRTTVEAVHRAVLDGSPLLKALFLDELKETSDASVSVLEYLRANESVRARVAILPEEGTKKFLSGKGNFAFPDGLETLAPDVVNIAVPKLWIDRLTDSIGSFGELRVLNLSGNLFESVPASIGKLDKLVALDLSGSFITALPAEISGCVSLKKLDLSGTRIESLPKELLELEHLEKVDLRGTNCDVKTCAIYAELVKRGVEVKIGPAKESSSPSVGIAIPMSMRIGGDSAFEAWRMERMLREFLDSGKK